MRVADAQRRSVRAGDLLVRVGGLDRRFIYLLVLVAVGIPTFFSVPSVVAPTPPVTRVFQRIEALPPGSVVWMPFDLWASNRAEIEPGALAVLRHLFARGHRVVASSLIPDGASICEAVLGRAAAERHKVYGTDYVMLGYKAGSATIIKQACGNLDSAWPTDARGTPLGRLPLTRSLHGLRDADLVFAVCDNNLLDAYAAIVATEHGKPLAGVTNAVMMPILSPYLDAGQISGLVGGLRGGAEYETLTGRPGDATDGMTAQSTMHLLIAALIIIANLSYAAERRRAGSPETAS